MSLNSRACSTIVRHCDGLSLLQLTRIWSEAHHHNCELTLTCNDKRANASRILDLIQLAAHQGDCVLIEASGAGADACVAQVRELIETGCEDSAVEERAFDATRHPIPQPAD